VWESQKSFGATVARWSDVSERAYFRARSV
jgi:hypothetical protein